MGFRDFGFQIFPSVLGAADLGAARAEVEVLCGRARAGELEGAVPLARLKAHRNPGVSLEDLAREPFIINSLVAVSEVFRGILMQASLWDLAAAVLGTSEVVYHFANLTRKPAKIGPNLNWHRDYPNGYICPAASEHFFRLLIPLEDMDEGNGCTLVLPGTHLVSDEVARAEEARRDFEISAAVPLVASAGDGLAIHAKVVHGGAVNRSERDRNLLVVQFGVRTGEYLYWAEDGFTGMGRGEILGGTRRNDTGLQP